MRTRVLLYGRALYPSHCRHTRQIQRFAITPYDPKIRWMESCRYLELLKGFIALIGAYLWEPLCRRNLLLHLKNSRLVSSYPQETPKRCTVYRYSIRIRTSTRVPVNTGVPQVTP